MSASSLRPVRSLAILSSDAFTLVHFRGPLIRKWIALGIRVYALAPNYDDASRAAVRALGAEPIVYPLDRAGVNPLADLFTFLRLTLILRQLRLDATFHYQIKPIIYGLLAAHLAGVPRRYALVAGLGIVYTDSLEPSSRRRRLLARGISWLYRMGLVRAQRVIFQNDADEAEFVARGIVRAQQTYLVPGTGVDLEEWTPQPAVTEPVTFVLAARLLREKGIREFVAAGRLLREDYPSVQMLLLGTPDPNPLSPSREEIAGWVAEGIVTWPGRVTIGPWLAQSSVFVLPTYYREGVPRSIQEAMAMGRPIITSDQPGCRETVVEGVNGYLVPVRDVPALAAAMRRFVEEPWRIAAMGAASRSLAEARFDVHQLDQQLLTAMDLGHAPHANRG
jgi:glycosyltransferase involved in cell wall biosynthesis